MVMSRGDVSSSTQASCCFDGMPNGSGGDAGAALVPAVARARSAWGEGEADRVFLAPLVRGAGLVLGFSEVGLAHRRWEAHHGRLREDLAEGRARDGPHPGGLVCG